MTPTDREQEFFYNLAIQEYNAMIIEFLGISPDEWIEQRANELMDYKLAEYRAEEAEEHYDMIREDRLIEKHFSN